jgi:hypothetical protein
MFVDGVYEAVAQGPQLVVGWVLLGRFSWLGTEGLLS